MGDGKIRTNFDDLISSLQDSGGMPVSVSRLAAICSSSDKTVLEWVHILENEGKVKLINRLDGVYAEWKHDDGSHNFSSSQSKESSFQGPTESFESQLKVAREREEQIRLETERRKAPHAKIGEERELQSESDSQEIEEEVEKLMSEAKEKGDAVNEGAVAQPDIAVKGEAGNAGNGVPSDIAKQQINQARNELSTLDDELSKVERAIDRLEKIKENENQLAVFSHEQAEKEKAKAEAKVEAEEPILAQAPEIAEAIESAEANGPEGKEAETEEEQKAAPQNYLLQKLGRHEGKIGKKSRQSRFPKIKQADEIKITEVSLQFTERMERQMRKVEKAAHEVEVLRAQKEQLLSEHYLPMQRRLESEIDTINDRIMKVENGIFGLQKRASDLPSKVGAMEKVQSSTINAHNQMRKAYDEAAALLEQSSMQLADEIGRMEELAEQCRSEISGHSAKSGELSKTLERIDKSEGELSYQVSVARSALAEQAEKLANAEKYANELANFREEIADNVAGIRREMGSTKGMLTELENQMSQMRHIEKWANSIRQDYESKMQEIDDYIKNGNNEFETLREAAEARFVRKYLRELRTLSDSYTFELNQAKTAETDLDSRILIARKRLDELIEEGQQLSYQYESAAKIPDGAEKFLEHQAQFDSNPQLEAKRSKIEQMIAQVVGKKTEYEESSGSSSPPARPAPIRRIPVALARQIHAVKSNASGKGKISGKMGKGKKGKGKGKNR